MYDDLTFPLNVYANILAFDKQPVDYLHFGLFEKEDLSMGEAQKKSTETIFSFLPSAPATILEVGIGLGTTQKILLENGYLAQGLTPDENQIQVAQSRLGGKGNLFCEFFEEFSSTEKFDVILFQESSQYIRVEKLFEQIKHFLNDTGRVIIIDEVCLNPQLSSGLHNPEIMLKKAEEIGLTASFTQDLSDYAKPTMNYIKEKLNQFKSEILDILNNDGDLLQHLQESTDSYLKNYSTGNYGYYLFVFDNQPS